MNETFGVIAYNPGTDTITCAFRGSYYLQNWHLDFESWLIPYTPGKGKVHHGFHEAYQGLQEQVITAVRGYLAEYPTASI